MKDFLQIDNSHLVEECIMGNPEALDHFYTRFAPKMLSVIMRYVPNLPDAEDILHDGFVIAFTRLKSLHNHDKVEYWLASIMKNLSLQFLQSQDVVSILEELPEIEDTPEFSEIIDLAVLESLIEKLPKGYQKVFRLSVLENKTHKEIAAILGIAPNSSSSQLFHAKVMMRKLVTEYRKKADMLVLVALVVTCGVLLWNRNHFKPSEQDRADLFMDSRNSENPGLIPESVSASKIATGNTHAAHHNTPYISPRVLNTSIRVDANSLSEDVSIAEIDTLSDINSSPAIIADHEQDTRPAVKDSVSFSRPDELSQDLFAYEPYINPIIRDSGPKWSLKASVSPDFLPHAAQDSRDPEALWPGSNEPPSDDDESGKSQIMKLPRNDDFSRTAHHNDMPVSAGVYLHKSLNSLVGIETGLTYTYLHSSFYEGSAVSDSRWHYLGIPLKLTFTNWNYRRLKLYAAAGIQFNIPIFSSASVSTAFGSRHLPDGKFRSAAAWSASLSYGISFSFSQKIGVFIEPSLLYNFTHGFHVPNYWTDNRWGFALPIGFIFDFE